jgi:hypothetical protein
MKRKEFPCFNLQGKTSGVAINKVFHYGMECFQVILDDVKKYYGEAQVYRERIVNIKMENCHDI